MEETSTPRFVTRALLAVRRYGASPDQIDHAILCAINATLCLCSGGDDRVAEGFNHDVAVNGREFHGMFDLRGRVAREAMLATN
jgi:hypothetical protein